MSDPALTSAVEVPPNKAIAAGGAAGLAPVIVGLGLYYFAKDTPPEIVGMWTALASALLTAAATYFTPHGAVVK